jgi:hypothetical protein
MNLMHGIGLSACSNHYIQLRFIQTPAFANVSSAEASLNHGIQGILKFSAFPSPSERSDLITHSDHVVNMCSILGRIYVRSVVSF